MAGEKTLEIDLPDSDPFQYILGENTEFFGANYASVKSISPELAIQEISGQNSIPDLRCHFSGGESPWIKFIFDKPYFIKSIKLFNMKNGFEKSNLEGAKFFVGEKLCAIAPLQLPENSFIEIECLDPDAESSAFGA